jgi:prepilin-type N-terminal cleavage/methylation domain-containing protein
MQPHGLATTWRPASIWGWRRAPALPAQRISRGKRLGFTLVELLTVIAIIAVLATLLMTTLSSAKRKAREAVCISNLHQIGLALNLYLEDFGKRPPDLATLVTSKYLGSADILACPADRTRPAGSPTPGSDAVNGAIPPAQQPHVSYEHPLSWPDGDWDRLMRAHSEAGVVACTFHDVRTSGKRDQPDNVPLEGLILRGQLDGVVVRRQVFLTQGTADFSPPPTTAVDRGSDVPLAAPETDGNLGFVSPTPPWHYFTDELQP